MSTDWNSKKDTIGYQTHSSSQLEMLLGRIYRSKNARCVYFEIISAINVQGLIGKAH